MNKEILFVGLDVDDKNYHGHVLNKQTGESFAFKCKANPALLLGKLRSQIEAGYLLDFCYESSHIGYSLCRELRKAGHRCSIIASALIPELAGNRVKNDRLDAEKLCIYYAKGLLTEIYIPEAEDEYVRTLIRSRTFLKEQHKEIKKHMVSLTKQLGWNYRQEIGEANAGYWTGPHKTWLKEKLLSAPQLVKLNFELLQGQMASLESRLEEYEFEITKLSQSEKYDTKIKSLTCYRGIDILGAMMLVTELGDIRRFAHPAKLVSYVGLDVSEYSSGGKERRFSLTKMGNKHVRKILVEISQSYHRKPVVGKPLKKRREGTSLELTSIADRCMNRLHKRALHLGFRQKPVNKIKAACARELVGFVWESLLKVS